jgi:hypothetical protein
VADNNSRLLNKWHDSNSSYIKIKIVLAHFPQKSTNLSNLVFTMSMINDDTDIKWSVKETINVSRFLSKGQTSCKMNAKTKK